MIGRDRIVGSQRKLGAKFFRSLLELALMKVNDAGVVVHFRKTGIQFQRIFQLVESVGIIFLLGVSLAEQKMD